MWVLFIIMCSLAASAKEHVDTPRPDLLHVSKTIIETDAGEALWATAPSSSNTQEDISLTKALSRMVINEKGGYFVSVTFLIGFLLLLLLFMLLLAIWSHRKQRGKRLDQPLRIEHQQYLTGGADVEDAVVIDGETYVLLPKKEYVPPRVIIVQAGDMDEKERQQLLEARLRVWLLEDKRFAKVNKQTADEAAMALQTNRTYLREAIKRATGKTLQEYIRSLQFAEAIRLLEENNSLKIETIASRCGLSHTTLYRFIKEKFHLTPSEYRKMAYTVTNETA